MSMILLLLVLAATSLACDSSDSGRRPNFIVVSIDTLNRSALGAFEGSAGQYPTLDRFAGGAARFVNAHSTGSWTLPAHGSLMTGLYPDRHGAVDRRRALEGSTPTLAGLLRAAGYETVGFTDGGYLASRFGFATGFDRYDDWSADGSVAKGWKLPRDGKRAEPAGSALFDRGIDYLRQRQPDGPPFLLFLHTYAVHDYFRLHSWATGRLPTYADRSPEEYVDCLTGVLTCSEADWRRLESLYAAELPNLDAGVARLLEALESVAQDTFVIVLSDHGEGFDPERGRVHHGGRLHEDQVRIPLLVAGPGVVARSIGVPVSLVDVMPTVMELAGIEPTPGQASPPGPAVPGLDGRSFVDHLRTGEARETIGSRALYAFEHAFFWSEGRRRHAPETRDDPYSVAVVRGDYWYVQREIDAELYRMADDPDQAEPLSGETAIALELRKLADVRNFASQGREHTIDGETEQRLRSLGYIR